MNRLCASVNVLGYANTSWFVETRRDDSSGLSILMFFALINSNRRVFTCRTWENWFCLKRFLVIARSSSGVERRVERDTLRSRRSTIYRYSLLRILRALFLDWIARFQNARTSVTIVAYQLYLVEVMVFTGCRCWFFTFSKDTFLHWRVLWSSRRACCQHFRWSCVLRLFEEQMQLLLLLLLWKRRRRY